MCSILKVFEPDDFIWKKASMYMMWIWTKLELVFLKWRVHKFGEQGSCFGGVHSIRDDFALIVSPSTHWSCAFTGGGVMWWLKSDHCWVVLLLKSVHWWDDDKLCVNDVGIGLAVILLWFSFFDSREPKMDIVLQLLIWCLKRKPLLSQKASCMNSNV